MEARFARDAGITFVGIQAGKYRRMPNASLLARLKDVESLALNIRDVGRLGLGVAQAFRALQKFRPNVIFAKGGFVAVPVVIAARILRIPVVAHESDVTPGIGSKVASRWAQAMAVGFPEELYVETLGNKVVFTGNPVRPDVLGGDPDASKRHFFGAIAKTQTQKAKTLPVVLVIGGSSGAHTINHAVVGALSELVGYARIIHITGQRDHAVVAHAAREHGLVKSQYCTFDFLDVKQMKQAYAAADVVVSRAGANTITELAAVSRPVILIPNNQMAAHQLMNAKRLAAMGAVELLVEEDLNPKKLVEVVRDLLAQPKKRKQLVASLEPIYVPDAADKVAQLLMEAAV